MSTTGQNVEDPGRTLMCWSCGLGDPGNPCRECSSATTIQRMALDRTGSACVVGRDLNFVEGIVLRDQGEVLSVLHSEGSVDEFSQDDVQLGQPTPGISQACSPAGQLLLLSGSPTFAALRGSPDVVERLVRQMVTSDLQAQRLLAVDALRCHGWARVLDWLDLTESEKSWLRSIYHAETGDWSACFAELSRLPHQRYPARAQLLLQGRNALRALPAQRASVVETLQDQDEPWVRLLALWLNGGDAIGLNEVALAATDRSPRILQLVAALREGNSVRDFVDIAPDARALDALTNTRPWAVSPSDIKGRTLTYIDELIDRGQMNFRDIPNYRALLDGPGAAYVTARLDPRQLSDDEVEEYGPVTERERRALLRGELTITAQSDSPGLRKVALVEQALTGSREALNELRAQLRPEQLRILEDACGSIADGRFPDPGTLVDRTLWPSLERELGPDRIAAASDRASSPESRAFVAWASLRAAKGELHRWHWEAARDLAQSALRTSNEETISDEALNLIAAAQHQMGNHSVAFRALAKALEGEYNAALQSNAVSVATHAAPNEAAALLATLVAQAPDLDARLAAAQRGIRMWRESQGATPFPSDFVRALRHIIVEPIDMDDFTAIAEVLASEDEDWFANQGSLRGSPHEKAPRTQFLRTRIRDYAQAIRLLAKFLRSGSREDPWLRNERDLMVGMVINAMHEQQEAIAFANVAYEMVDAGLPMDVAARHEMILLAARENCLVMNPEEACLRDDRVDAATASWHYTRGTSGPDSDRLRAVADACMNVLGRHLGTFHYNALVNAGLTDYERMYGPEAVLLEKMQAQVFWSNEWLGRVQTLRPTVTDPEALQFLDLITEVALGVMREEWV